MADRMTEYLEKVKERQAEHPEWRKGQTLFNVLFFDGFDPDFADYIRGDYPCPFYFDERIPDFMEALETHWAGSSAPSAGEGK